MLSHAAAEKLPAFGLETVLKPALTATPTAKINFRPRTAERRSQHMFLQPDASPSKSGYKNAYNCVASLDNKFTFNDGYHIQHHLNSQLHWSELPHQFVATLAEHGRQKGASP